MKIAVLYDYEENKKEVLSIEEFVKKFNRAEINSATDFIELIKE